MKKARAERLRMWKDVKKMLEAGIPMGQKLEIPVPEHSDRRLADSIASRVKRIAEKSGPHYVYRKRGSIYVKPLSKDVELHTCECGAKFQTLRGAAHHKAQGVCERNLQIKEWLQSDCVRFSHVADEFGMTRERVRQVAHALGVEPGHKRQLSCSAKRRAAFVPPKPRWYDTLNAAVQPFGFTIEYTTRRARAKVNGITCAVGNIWAQKCHQRRADRTPRTRYIIHTHTPLDYQFALLHAPDGGWFVFPVDKLAKPGTTFIYEDLILPGTDHTKHYWRDYRERWDLLGAKKNAATLSYSQSAHN